jgi:inosine/guanosine/xanthosine phosphorylase family protein
MAALVLKRLSRLRPRLAIILGSGLGKTLENFEPDARISYRAIPGFKPVAVPGHPGYLFIGCWANLPVLILAGRAHFYEGNSMASVTFCIRALAAYGIEDILLTNCAGGIRPRLKPGDFMIVRDHINFMGVNPLRENCPDHVACFVDLTQVYDRALSRLLELAGREVGLRLSSGVYLALSGPSYETPAEIRAFRSWGADAVGMSTVPEAVVARQCGLRVAALSCITNRAAGLRNEPGLISHEEVLQTASRVKSQASRLLYKFVQLYGREAQDSN